MTKTELKKQQVKTALDFLESFDNVEIEDNGDGGRMSITFGQYHGEFSRRDLEVSFYESIKLGPGFSDEEIYRNKVAMLLETELNQMIKERIENLVTQ